MMHEGLLLVDKPSGPTSHDVINRLRHLTGMRRFGHAGTLDPLATGLLLVGAGRATRLLEYLIGQPKRYEAAVHLGQRTDTYDAQGRVIEEHPVSLTADEIEEALAGFRGSIVQYAPAYSAVKREGQPLYKLARQGADVERPPRNVTIHRLDIRSWQPPLVELEVSCSSGTYIRALADDLGQTLGCGGHISALRRTAVGDFAVDQAVPFDDLESENWTAFLLPPDAAVSHLPRVEFSADIAARLLQGQRAPASGSLPEGSPARAYDDGSRFLGIIIAAGDTWKPHKMFLE
jgi:tRNA pseudouridine55 synthase